MLWRGLGKVSGEMGEEPAQSVQNLPLRRETRLLCCGSEDDNAVRFTGSMTFWLSLVTVGCR